VLLETDILGASRILRISWDEAWHIQERAVARGQQAKPAGVPARLGIAEKAAAKGQRYLTLVANQSGRLLPRADARAASDDRRDRDGHVGARLRVGPDLRTRRGRQDRVRFGIISWATWARRSTRSARALPPLRPKREEPTTRPLSLCACVWAHGFGNRTRQARHSRCSEERLWDLVGRNDVSQVDRLHLDASLRELVFRHDDELSRAYA
jgi:hypothetical protein